MRPFLPKLLIKSIPGQRDVGIILFGDNFDHSMLCFSANLKNKQWQDSCMYIDRNKIKKISDKNKFAILKHLLKFCGTTFLHKHLLQGLE
jgi:hypothetical protein